MNICKKPVILLLLFCSFFLVSCNNYTERDSSISAFSYTQTQTPSTSGPSAVAGSGLFSFTDVKAIPGVNKQSIEGANYYNRGNMVSDGSRLYFIMPDFGQTIMSCDMRGQDPRLLADGSNIGSPEAPFTGGFIINLNILDDVLYFIVCDVGLLRIPVYGGKAEKIIEGNIQEYIITDTTIYFSDCDKEDGYTLNSYKFDTKETTNIDRLSLGIEPLKLGGYIVGFFNGVLVYTQRDEDYRRSYFSCYSDGQISAVPYNEGQEIETAAAKANIRPLDEESSEVNHVDGKSVDIKYTGSGPNLLYLSDNGSKQPIAEVNGDHVFIYNSDIYVLDEKNNIERIVFNNIG